MNHYNNLQEEELKIRIAEQFFASYDCGNRIGKIDFCVTQIQDAKRVIAGEACFVPTEGRETVSLLWAEAKRGMVADIYKPLVQLILTIGKARTFETYLPPPFLAAFDAEKIAFISYKEILPFFSLNDFNWNVASSDSSSREFGLLYDAVRTTLESSSYLFRYDVHEAELRAFIKQHLSESSELIPINKNNFVSIYQRWLAQVQPSIDVDWGILKKSGLVDGDFFLADLFSAENQTIKEALYVLLKENKYIVDRKIDARGLFTSSEVFFNDRQKAHTQFWNLYQRPPREVYWDYIINRRDLLVPQDVRERKGSFFTPKIWVDLSQKYLADVLGENWQDEYYVWDCAAGTGNLLNGLTNKYNIWASTLDQQDVDVMKDRIKNGANLLESHVFQFDFLNDEFTKLPQPLQDIINDPEKRKKLVIYINPPYAEAGNARTRTGERNKNEVATTTQVWKDYGSELGLGIRELFAQFMIRINKELKPCKLAIFSTPKYITGTAFRNFREMFPMHFIKGFVVPAYTFDNVKGEFPISFIVWDSIASVFPQCVKLNIYNAWGICTPLPKIFAALDKTKRITSWLQPRSFNEQAIGYTGNFGPDFQHNRDLCILNTRKTNSNNVTSNATKYTICATTLLQTAIYLAIRLSNPSTWLNDRDQFLYPNEGWRNDLEFQNDCLTFALFSPKNNIQSQLGTNYWIPFTEEEVNAKEKFESHFMTEFMAGKLAKHQLPDQSTTSLRELGAEKSFVPTEPLVFSPEATAVFDAGRELWRYYHAQPNANPNASYYDIREHFQGRNEKGRMNPTSNDTEYMRLLGNLKAAMEALRLKIVPKVYEYGFLI